MNYTQKLSFSANTANLSNNFIDSKKNQEAKSSAFASDSVALLGNREIGKPNSKFEHIYKKYMRKQISQYALTVGNTKKLALSKNQKRTRLKKEDFNTKLSF